MCGCVDKWMDGLPNGWMVRKTNCFTCWLSWGHYFSDSYYLMFCFHSKTRAVTKCILFLCIFLFMRNAKIYWVLVQITFQLHNKNNDNCFNCHLFLSLWLLLFILFV